MAMVETVIKGDPMGMIRGMRTKAHKAHLHAIKKGIAHIQRHHKREEWVTGGMGKHAKAPHPTKLSVRTAVLKRSYKIIIDKKKLEARYGTDVKYARVHEFGLPGRNIRKRPGLQNTITATGSAIEKILANALKKEGL